MIEQILEADRYLQVDQVDRAREIYTRVVEMDPGNAIATVGLAQCELADGDDAEAYALAARALTIDPENDMARRMEARLAEILTTRGESVERPDAVNTPAKRSMRPMVAEPEPAPEPAAEPSPEPTPVAEPEPAAEPSPEATHATAALTTPTPSTASNPSSTRTVMRKSFLDRLLGR